MEKKLGAPPVGLAFGDGMAQWEEWEVQLLTGFTLGLGLKNLVLILILPWIFLVDSTDILSSSCSLTFTILTVQFTLEK